MCEPVTSKKHCECVTFLYVTIRPKTPSAAVTQPACPAPLATAYYHLTICYLFSMVREVLKSRAVSVWCILGEGDTWGSFVYEQGGKGVQWLLTIELKL